MLSRVYQLASAVDLDVTERPGNQRDPRTLDPENEYLWHYARRRLDAEAIRDTMLVLSGTLERAPGGPHPFPDQRTWDFTQHKPFKAVYDTRRRSVYLMTQRIQRHPFLAIFDGPDTNASTASRTTSTTPLQALFLMNDPFVHEQARHFAARLMTEAADDGSRIEKAFLLAFARPPTAVEQKGSLHFLQQARETLRTSGATDATLESGAWESFARALFMSNELIYVE
jgi:hypothetical protein